MRHLSLRSLKAVDHAKQQKRRPQVERLEIRHLLTALFGSTSRAGVLSTGFCGCSICTGEGLSALTTTSTSSTSNSLLAGAVSVSTGPQFSSNPSAKAKLFLDFNGHFEATWGSRTNITTPAFDQDGDASTFSDAELSTIQQIWAMVAEDYAPFNIDVTTIDPGSLANQVVACVAIGGSNTDWYGSNAGGVAYVGGFYNTASNVAYAFENNLGNGNVKYTSEAISHEAGHLFGLNHQSVWNGTTLVTAYNQGNSSWAPIMGVGYYSTRSTWHNGTTNLSSTTYQDNIAVLANATNGFGLKVDDYGSTIATATELPLSGSSVNFAGLLGHHTDQDVWKFTTGGGSVSFSLNVARFGPNLDAILEIRNSSGTLIVSSDLSTSLNASLSATLGSGTFYVIARSNGSYGNMGQYTLTGTLPAVAPNPEITVLVGSTALASGGTLSFGAVQMGNFVDRTVTIRNEGATTLTLASINPATLPVGFSLVSNIGNLQLGVGATTSFVLRLTGAAAGSFSGVLNLASNDADEGTYAINLSGTVTAPNPEITVLVGSTSLTSGGALSFGSVQLGTSVDRTVTIRNDGTTTLNLTSINAATLPAGFALVSNIGNLQLGVGATTSFVLRLTGAAAGSFSGVLNLASNDADEGTYAIHLSGTVTAPNPEITVLVGSTSLASGGALSFGSVQLGASVDRTVTIRNDGTTTLTLTSINPTALPVGFSLVSNIGSLQLGVGATTSFVLRLTGATAGSFSGVLNVASNDADEGTYAINLAGTVTAPNPEITVLVGSAPLSAGGALNFGSIQLGTSVDRTVTIRNDGVSTLTLTSINANSLPAGFTLVSNIGNLVLGAGASTSYVLRLSGSTPGNYGGVLNVLSDDADEGTFGISLSGSVISPTWGSIDFFLSENRIATGDQWFGATASRTGWFSAEAYFDHNLGNVDVEIYNAHNQLLGRSNSLTGAERVDVAVAAGQQLFIHIVGANSNVTYRCVNLVSGSGDTIHVHGTEGDDLLVMLPGSGTHRVAVNGVGYNFNASNFNKIVVEDTGGVDTLIVVGNEQNEAAVVSQASASVSGSAYALTATGAEFVELQGDSGHDSALFYDRAGNDTYTGNPTEGVLRGTGYSSKATGFDVVKAVFNAGGYDQAFLYGSIGDDRYEASPTSAFLQGPDFRHEASNYDTVVGVGGAGNDLALLHDTAGDEIYNGDPNAATLSSATMYLRAELFDRVEARSSGGYDVATLLDSAGNDAMGASKVLAYLNGVGFSNYVEGFDRVTATSTGGLDTADLYDSAGDDLLTINGGTRRLESSDYYIQTDGFRTFRAFGSTGNDRVTMQNLVNTDKIQGRSNWATLSNNTGRTHTVTGFDQVTAVAKTRQKPKADVTAVDYVFTKIGW